jgi:hypothetical protein
MASKRWADIRAKKRFTPAEEAEIRAKVDAMGRELDLRAIRELAGKTQVDVAGVTTMSQSEVSKLERRTDHRLSTLQRYVEALGGKLEVFAVFGDRSVRVRSAEPRRAAPKKPARKSRLATTKAHA